MGGSQHVPPPTDQNVLNFMQFFGKLGNNYMLVPLLEGWHHLLWKSWIRPCSGIYQYEQVLNSFWHQWGCRHHPLPEFLFRWFNLHLKHLLLDFFVQIWTQDTLRHILGPICVIFEICHLYLTKIISC